MSQVLTVQVRVVEPSSPSFEAGHWNVQKMFIDARNIGARALFRAESAHHLPPD